MPEPGLPDIDSLWDYDDPAGTEATFRNLLPEADNSGNRAFLAELLTQIARAQGLQQKFDDAHRTLDNVASFLFEAGPRARIRYLLERGRAFNSARRPDEARPLFLEAWQLAVDEGEDYFAADAAHMMGIIEPAHRQLEWGHKAMGIAEESSDPRAQEWLGSLYNNIGWTYHDLGRYDEALTTFEKGLHWQRQRGKARETRIAAWTVARTLRSLDKYEDALEMQQENLRQIRATDDPDGYVEEELGECLLALGREVEARDHFAQAFAVLSQDPWLTESEPGRLERLQRLGSTPGNSIGTGSD